MNIVYTWEDFLLVLCVLVALGLGLTPLSLVIEGLCLFLVNASVTRSCFLPRLTRATAVRIVVVSIPRPASSSSSIASDLLLVSVSWSIGSTTSALGISTLVTGGYEATVLSTTESEDTVGWPGSGLTWGGLSTVMGLVSSLWVLVDRVGSLTGASALPPSDSVLMGSEESVSFCFSALLFIENPATISLPPDFAWNDNIIICPKHIITCFQTASHNQQHLAILFWVVDIRDAWYYNFENDTTFAFSEMIQYYNIFRGIFNVWY